LTATHRGLSFAQDETLEIAARRPGQFGHEGDFAGIEHFQAKWTPVRVKKMRQNISLWSPDLIPSNRGML
jgi:hypothetical protein